MDVYLSTDHNKQDIVIAWTAAILIHVLFFSLTGKMFIKPVEFAIVPSREIIVNLVDEPQKVPQIQEKQKPVIKKIEKIISPILKPSVKTIENPKVLMTSHVLVKPSARVLVEAKPDYIQNPSPPYPELARQMRQEGLVLLTVVVNKDGDPVKIEIKQSSGFHLLDQAAYKAVCHWKFQPGSIGSIPIESTVTVPIRFRLE